MAIYDKLFEFCDDDTVFSTDTSVISENILDMDSLTSTYVARGMGGGEPLWLNIRVGTTDFAGGTSAQFKWMAHTSTTISSGTVIYETPAIGVGTLVAGYDVFRCPLPVNFDAYRYVGLVVTCVGAVSAGTINAWIDNGSQSSFNTQASVSNI